MQNAISTLENWFGSFLQNNIWDFQVVQWLRLCAPNAGFDPWSGNQIPHTATRSLNAETKRSCIPHAATKTLHSHINILKRNTPNISLPYHPTTPLLSIYAREMKINIHKRTVPQSSYLCLLPKQKTTKISYNSLMVKQTAIHPYRRILISNKNE